MLIFLILLTGAYLAGSVNFPILLFKILGKGDPRDEFSANPGAFNVYRQLGVIWALVILLLDISRAVAVALISVNLLSFQLVPWVGLGLILGNRLPCFHGFKGGKGVANYLGFSALIVPTFAAISVPVWLVMYALFRIAFIGSLLMVFILGAGTLYLFNFDPTAGTGVLATMALIIYSHKQNIRELLQKKKQHDDLQ